MGIDLGIVAILSIVLVPLVSLLKQEKWPTKVKFVISSVVSLIAGVVVTLINGHGHVTDLVAAATTSFATMQVVYRMYFEGTVTDIKLTAVNS